MHDAHARGSREDPLRREAPRQRALARYRLSLEDLMTALSRQNLSIPGGVIEACVRHGQPAFTGDAAGLKAPGFAGIADDRAGFGMMQLYGFAERRPDGGRRIRTISFAIATMSPVRSGA